FSTGQVHYTDGQSDALSATTLKADTEGVKLDTVKVVGADGKLQELDAGALIVHEGYDGKTRTNSYELQAKSIGDWEGTAEQEQHRHGGGNMTGAPTQTRASSAGSLGAVLGKDNVTTQTTMDVGDRRITSDAPAAATGGNKPATGNATLTLNAGDARITSNKPASKPVVFVPPAAGTLGQDDADEDGWIHIPGDGLFGKGGINAALTAVALGAVQTTAYAMADPKDSGFAWQTAGLEQNTSPAGSGTHALPVGEGGTADAPGTPPGGTIALENFAVVHQMRLGVLAPLAPPPPPVGVWTTTITTTGTPGIPPGQGGGVAHAGIRHYTTTDTAPVPVGFVSTTPATLYIAPGHNNTNTNPQTNTPGNTAPAPSDSTPTAPGASATPPAAPATPTPQAPIDTTPTAPTLNSATTANDLLSDPQEEAVLHVSVATLLANDTNAVGIAQVGNAQHGTVTLSGSEVIFTPEANYHGPASFAYVVTGQDGGRAAGVASFTITAVNDVPIALGETRNASEDSALTITQATLLANDTDVDVATDGQTLRVSAVGHAQNGTVSVLGDGSIRFTPDADFHGTGSFEYVVSDGNGGTAIATATVQVAAVNDVPDALGESIASAEDTTLVLTPAALLANDTDPDVATDGQTLAIGSVGNASHGTVSLLGNGSVQFVPDANYTGTATFDYVVSDGAGGTATATATVLVGSTDDAPVASGETVASQEDQTVTLTAAALLANDTDVDNATSELAIARVAAGTGGTVTLNASGNIVFTPTANFSGTASFTYWVKDPAGLESNAATVTVNVAPVNDSPYAQGESLNGASEDAVFNIDRGTLLANDGDAEDANGALGIAWVGNASNGTVSLDGSGNVVFTPTANYNGNASFEYTVRDSGGAVSPTVSAQFQVAAVNDNPVGVDNQFAMYTNTPTSSSTATIGFNQLVGNDTDIDNPHSDLTVGGVRNANSGTVSIVNGQVSFTPTVNFNGTASFEYQVTDQHGGTTWATAFVTVAPPPNHYPSVNVTYANFYPTGTTPAGAFDIGDVSFSAVDDGNTSLVSITYLGGTYHVFGDPGPATSSIPWNIFTTTQSSWYIDVPRPSALDAFDTSWQVVDDRGLSNIWRFGYTVGSGVRSTMDFSGYAPPVVLGLDGSAPSYIATHNSNVRFDLNGDGVADQVAWAAAGSGVLGIDLNGDQRISNASEFTFTQYVPGAKTDLQGLRAFDTNYNGVLDAGDARWAQFGVWEDKNSDGKTDEGEYLTLDQLGIANIDLSEQARAPAATPEAPDASGHLSGVAVVGTSTFTRTDGSTGRTDDAMLAFGVAPESFLHPDLPPLPPADPVAEFMRQMLLANQYANTCVDDSQAPLGYVPIQTDGHWQDAVPAVPANAMHEVQGA
ncbi:MAG: tandem-95 repeat protein, partial [Rhodoferax sp.]